MHHAQEGRHSKRAALSSLRTLKERLEARRRLAQGSSELRRRHVPSGSAVRGRVLVGGKRTSNNRSTARHLTEFVRCVRRLWPRERGGRAQTLLGHFLSR